VGVLLDQLVGQREICGRAVPLDTKHTRSYEKFKARPK